MRRWRRTLTFWWGLLACLLPLAAGAPLAHAASGTAPVLAVYYAWYGLPSWDPNKMSDLPVTLYNSGVRATMQQQVAEAQSAGIDAFELDWVGPNDSDGIDHNLQTLLSVADSTGFHVTAYVDLNLIKNADVLNDLSYLKRYFSDPAWFHFGGKPFVAFYHVSNLDVGTWQAIFNQVDPDHQVFWMAEGVDMSYLQAFDGIHPFSIAWASDPAGQLAKLASWTRAYPGKAWMATVMPGNDDTHLGRPDGFKVDRQNGAYYTSVWQGAIATHPDLISITSWNEWFEGTQIEPSRTYGNLYLQLTKQLSDQYRATMGAPPEPSTPATSPSGCQFVLGFAALDADLPLQVGQCVDDESHAANGDALQHTTGGMLVWRKADNWTAFTDGYHTWVNGPRGIAERLNTQRFSWEANPSRLPIVSG